MPAPDFTPLGGNNTHDTVLLEWTAKTPGAATYDGGAPRELIRLRQPFANHNAGHLAFNPLTAPNGPDYGLLYMGVADGGSGGDPLEMGQNLGSAFGKIFNHEVHEGHEGPIGETVRIMRRRDRGHGVMRGAAAGRIPAP